MIFSANLWADDPLSNINGTEGWNNINSSGIEEEDLWNELLKLFRRTEFLNAILSYERTIMNRWAVNSESSEMAPSQETPEQRQIRIDTMRNLERLEVEIRDNRGQVIDSETPWDKKL